MNDQIIKTQQFDYHIDQVWKAISEGKEISAWFIQADFKAEVGYDYTFTHEKTVIKGHVLKVNPVYELVYTWIVSGTEVETTVSWKLEAQGDKTLLTLVHEGISQYPGETAIAMFNNYKNGWDNCTVNLLKHLAETVANAQS